MAHRTYTAEEVAKAIRDSNGIVGFAARRLGCHVKTVYWWINKEEVVSNALYEARQEILDTAEVGLQELVSDKNFGAIKFVLERFGAERGYAPRMEVTGKDGAPVAIEIKLPELPEETLDDIISQRRQIESSVRGSAGESDDLQTGHADAPEIHPGSAP